VLRDHSLVTLSHQHQHGLALCVQIERGLAADSSPKCITSLAGAAARHFRMEMAAHFKIEEEVLFPAASDDALVPELIAEHRRMEQLAAKLGTPTAALLAEYAALLRGHIRKEENTLFEDIQNRLPRATLDGLGREIDDRVHHPMTPSTTILLESNLPGVERRTRGKVRDVYSAGDRLLIVATDRISAFDYILPTGIPDKGRVLTQLSVFWFDFLRELTPTHFLTADVCRYPEPLPRFGEQLEGRSMLVKRAEMIQVECVARGYLSGSGWIEYQQSGSVCGVKLPAGLRESDKLPEPIFTPATKAQTGHDENVSFETVASLVGADLAARLRDMTLAIYRSAAEYAETRGIIIADTKFEFGFVDGELVLADEVLTPDSSRFWPSRTYRPGGPQPSFDKQYVRDYLLSIRWNKHPPAPPLPPDVAEKTADKYREAYHVLTGQDL
jgi:phosphoribosylaminoimidazole-succinocarboxamide synthase